ncbi:uncharacterized protein LOC117341818 [Pecten maximus]|uniref:uncharacterized protein LOC117341818 n=1 Tax=Pecten maximus TaxID=6579 RepID=UPI001458BB5C|nr:uncharacterized protein LOC117341818 [Pecten maximus]
MINLTVRVYNLTWTDDLAFNFSNEYLRHSLPFCEDIANIFRSSLLSSRYYNCEVQGFGNNPVTVNTHVIFKGKRYLLMQNHVIQVIKDKSKKIRVNDIELKMIGTLLIEPFDGGSVDVIDVGIDLGPASTTTIKPTPSTPAPDQTMIGELTVYLYNLTYSNDLKDINAARASPLARAFCKNLETFYVQSDLKGSFQMCTMTGFL